MRDERGFSGQSSVLTPSVPADIGARTQRQRILNAMAESCAEKSFSATTIADVVGLACISRATFYKHFADKRECFDAAVQEFVDELVEAASADRSASGSRTETMRKAIDGLLEQLAAKPAYAKLVAIEASILAPEVIVAWRDRVVAALEEQWEAGVAGRSAKADSRVAVGRAQMLVADRIAAGEADGLPALQPEIAYVLLLPFVGHKKALAQLKVAG